MRNQEHERANAAHGGKQQGLWAWWQRTGEPVCLGVLALLTSLLPLLVLTKVLTPSHALRGMLLLAWVAGLLLVGRLPRWLRQEQRRVALLAAVVVGALALAHLAGSDSSTLARPGVQRQALYQAQDVLSPTFKAPPRISREMFAQLLQVGTGGGGTSPAAPYADELYDIIVGYELDPAVALAFFAQESQFCTTGICASHNMHNWGGNRAAVNPDRVVDVVYVGSGPFVSYASWQDGLRDWCELILGRYVGQGLDTVEKAVPVYAPAFDGNNPAAYINSMHRRIAVWQGQDPGTPETLPSYANLETGLINESFRASDLDYNPEWAFHRYMVEEARAGRSLGSPLGPSRYITVNGRRYAVQTFALDTLYTPLADVESETNWSDVRRMSDLLRAPAVPLPLDAQPPAEGQNDAGQGEQQQLSPEEALPPGGQPAPETEILAEEQPAPTTQPPGPGVHTPR
jgi:hypothetical protein